MCGVQTFVAYPAPGVVSWLMLTLGPQEMGSFGGNSVSDLWRRSVLNGQE